MIYRMGAALLSLLGLFVSAYLYLYKIGRIGDAGLRDRRLRDGADQRLEPVRGRRGGAHRRRGLRAACSLVAPRGRCSRRLAGRRWPAGLLAALAGLGVLFTAYLTYLELFVLHAICRWCVGSAVIIVAILSWLALLALRRTAGRQAR